MNSSKAIREIGFGNVVKPDFGAVMTTLSEPPTQEGGMPTSNQTRRTCVRMSEKEYQRLMKKSRAAGLSANGWLMNQLENNQPLLFREPETQEVLDFMDKVGREVNEIAHDFNSGFGTKEQLQNVVRRMSEAYERIHALRKKGYTHAP